MALTLLQNWRTGHWAFYQTSTDGRIVSWRPKNLNRQRVIAYPRHTQDIQVQKVPSVALTHELREGDPGHATCEIDRSSLRKNIDLIWYNTIDAFPTWCTHFLRLRLSFKNAWAENDRNLTDIFQFLCCSKAPLAGSQNCAVLLSASDPGGPRGLRNGHLARQKHDFGSVELHLGFQESQDAKKQSRC